MPFNLLTDPFLPIITASGRRHLIRFAELFDQGEDPPVEFDWPRPDLNIASYEFCVGILSVVAQPDGQIWGNVWNDPPSPSAVDDKLEHVRPAFSLDGEGPRFMQAFEDIAGGEPNPIEALFIDTPGANAQKKNTDLLTHRGRMGQLGLPAAAMALYAMQQFAPSGGAGNRTSMRGGGPLTTLVSLSAPDRPVPLWRKLWLNVPVVAEKDTLETVCVPRVFPWLAPTLVSDKAHGERTVSQSDEAVHPLQAFFGMPRRIRLVMGGEPGRCGLLQCDGPVITGFTQVPWGMNYGVWEHPLTPYRQQKEDSEPYSVKPKSGRFGYRDWVSVTAGGENRKLSRPARNIAALTDRIPAILSIEPEFSGLGTAMIVGGWAMNNMEAIAYLHAHQPLYLASGREQQKTLESLARSMASAGDAAHDILRNAVRRAHFAEGAKPDTAGGMFNDLRNAFYAETDDAFHAILGDANGDGEPGSAKALDTWFRALRRHAVRLFELNAPDPAASPQNAERMSKAYSGLNLSLAGYGSAGNTFFAALDRPLPVSKKKEKADA